MGDVVRDRRPDSGFILTLDALLTLSLSVLLLSSVSLVHFPQPSFEGIAVQTLVHDLLLACTEAANDPFCATEWPSERGCSTDRLETIANAFPAFTFFIQYEDPYMLGVSVETLSINGTSYRAWYDQMVAQGTASSYNLTQFVEYLNASKQVLLDLPLNITADAQQAPFPDLVDHGLRFTTNDTRNEVFDALFNQTMGFSPRELINRTLNDAIEAAENVTSKVENITVDPATLAALEALPGQELMRFHHMRRCFDAQGWCNRITNPYHLFCSCTIPSHPKVAYCQTRPVTICDLDPGRTAFTITRCASQRPRDLCVRNAGPRIVTVRVCAWKE